MRLPVVETFHTFLQDPEQDHLKVFQDGEAQKFINWLKNLPLNEQLVSECQTLSSPEREAEIERLEALLAEEETLGSIVQHKLAEVTKYVCLILIQISPILIELEMIASRDNLLMTGAVSSVMAGWSYMATRLFFFNPQLK